MIFLHLIFAMKYTHYLLFIFFFLLQPQSPQAFHLSTVTTKNVTTTDNLDSRDVRVPKERKKDRKKKRRLKRKRLKKMMKNQSQNDKIKHYTILQVLGYSLFGVLAIFSVGLIGWPLFYLLLALLLGALAVGIWATIALKKYHKDHPEIKQKREQLRIEKYEQRAIEAQKAIDEQRAIDEQKAIEAQRANDEQRAIDEQKAIDEQRAIEAQRATKYTPKKYDRIDKWKARNPRYAKDIEGYFAKIKKAKIAWMLTWLFTLLAVIVCLFFAFSSGLFSTGFGVFSLIAFLLTILNVVAFVMFLQYGSRFKYLKDTKNDPRQDS